MNHTTPLIYILGIALLYLFIRATPYIVIAVAVCVSGCEEISYNMTETFEIHHANWHGE